MAGYRNDDLFEEEMNRLKRKEKEIQDEVYRERLAEKKQKYDDIRNRSTRSRSRDSSPRSTYMSYDIVQELEEERQRKRQLADELKTRERQIQKTSELLERQSELLASLEANTMRQNQSSMTNLIEKSQPSMPTLMGQGQPSMQTLMGQGKPSMPTLMEHYPQSMPTLIGQGQPSMPTLMGQPSIPSLMGQGQPSMPTLMGHNPQSMPTLMGQGQPLLYNQLTTSVYRQSFHTDYQYSQQYSLMNSVQGTDTVHPPYYQYNQSETTPDVFYNPHVGPLPVTGIVEGTAFKKAKTAQTGVSETGSNITDSDMKQKNPEVQCTFKKCKEKGHEVADCLMLKKKSLYSTCRYCKTLGHRIEQCPKLVMKRQKSKVLVCFNCNTTGHHCKDCPELMKSSRCYRCSSLEHQIEFCPQMKRSKKAQETETVNINEVDSITDISITPDTQNNITLSNLISCGDAQMNSSSSPTVSSSATRHSATSVERSTALNKSGDLVGTSVTTVKSETSKLSKSAKKRKRKASSITSSVNNQEQTSCVTSKELISNTSADVTSNPTKHISHVSPTNISNTYSVTATKTTVTSFAAKTVESPTDFDIAEEMEKFKANPKHMMSMAKYRRHIENLRKAEREKKSIVPTQTTEEKMDSSSDKLSVKQENASSSQGQTYNSKLPINSNVTQNTSPVKESFKEEDKPKSFACNVCQFTCYIQSEINTHKQTPLHIKKKEQCENGCKMCGKVKFKTISEYTSHNSQKLHKTLLQKKKQMRNTEVAKIANQVAGVEYVVPVSGFFCKLCKKFYNEKSYPNDHCKSKEHHEKLVDVLSSKYDPVIHVRVLEIYKAVQKHVKEKKVPERFLELLSKADFSNLIPVASAKSPVTNSLNSNKISQTIAKKPDSPSDVSKDSNLTQRFPETIKEVKANDISDAGDSVPKILDKTNIDSDRATAISEASDTCIKIETSVIKVENTEAETGNRYGTGRNQASGHVAIDKESKIDIDQELKIKNVTSLKSFNVNSDQVSSQIKSSTLKEGDRVLEAGGSSKENSVCLSSTPESLASKKKPENYLVLTEKMESIDPDTDILLADNDADDILCGDCDSDIDFSD